MPRTRRRWTFLQFKCTSIKKKIEFGISDVLNLNFKCTLAGKPQTGQSSARPLFVAVGFLTIPLHKESISTLTIAIRTHSEKFCGRKSWLNFRRVMPRSNIGMRKGDIDVTQPRRELRKILDKPYFEELASHHGDYRASPNSTITENSRKQADRSRLSRWSKVRGHYSYIVCDN
jgi:hypothetical protein